MKLALLLCLILIVPQITLAESASNQMKTRGYKRVPLQAENYPDELYSTACWMNKRKDVAIVDALPSTVDAGQVVLLPGADGDYLFEREARGWRLLTKFSGAWQAEGILLESGPCRIKPPSQGGN